MALNFLTPNTDFVQKTAESRRIAKPLVGGFTFDLFAHRYRRKVFLPRNMTKVLAFHERNRTRAIETGTLRSPSSRARGPVLGDRKASNRIDSQKDEVTVATDWRESELSGHEASYSGDPSSAEPDVQTMSQNCLKVKAQTGATAEQSSEKRRSIRHQLSRQHEDKNAQLYLDLVNIRKKLNFKESTLENDKRPRKRVKRESIQCHCHITIWDNRNGLEQKESIVRKSEPCEVSTSDLGTAGFLAEIKLQKPFMFKSSELFVPITTAQGTILGMGDQYFLEIKIIPARDDVDWPPIPVLGRSEGDQSTGLSRLAAEKLSRSLVARYTHLPHAPASDVPLSVFFLHNGTTYRSKYGLELNATWTKGDTPTEMARNETDEIQLDSWKFDEEGRAFGKRDTARAKDSPAASNEESLPKLPSTSPAPVKVVYNIDAASAKGSKDFRRCTLTGLRCLACLKLVFSLLEELQFHFMTVHAKHKFSLEKEEYSELTNELVLVVFKISSISPTRPRNSDREPRKADKDIRWQAPSEPLDVSAYVDGDQNWVERNWEEGVPKKVDAGSTATSIAPDPLSTVRERAFAAFAPAQKGGFLPAEYVSDFRPSARERYPNVKLRTFTEDKETMYSSVSHRQIQLGEEPRSESDDEIDDSWFVNKSLEALDIAAEKQGWTEEQRLLRRKWNHARLKEKLSHPRYLSDGLIRFVRAEKDWLNSGTIDRKAAFVEFIDELLQRRVIDQDVIRDLWTILHPDENATSSANVDGKMEGKLPDVPPTSPSKSDAGGSDLRRHQGLMTRQQQAEAMLRLPPYTCAICIEPIDELRRHGVHCSEQQCEAPNVWYHNKCVRCKRRDRFSWKCGLCIDRIEESRKIKAKERMVE